MPKRRDCEKIPRINELGNEIFNGLTGIKRDVFAGGIYTYKHTKRRLSRVF